jgi:hypothetical protein
MTAHITMRTSTSSTTTIITIITIIIMAIAHHRLHRHVRALGHTLAQVLHRTRITMGDNPNPC